MTMSTKGWLKIMCPQRDLISQAVFRAERKMNVLYALVTSFLSEWSVT